MLGPISWHLCLTYSLQPFVVLDLRHWTLLSCHHGYNAEWVFADTRLIVWLSFLGIPPASLGSFPEHYISSLSPRRSFHYYQIGLYVTRASIHEYFFLEENIHEIKSYSKVCSHKHALTLSHTISLYCNSITCTTHIDHQLLCMCKHDT